LKSLILEWEEGKINKVQGLFKDFAFASGSYSLFFQSSRGFLLQMIHADVRMTAEFLTASTSTTIPVQWFITLPSAHVMDHA
jgi:hypothetical protein